MVIIMLLGETKIVELFICRDKLLSMTVSLCFIYASGGTAMKIDVTWQKAGDGLLELTTFPAERPAKPTTEQSPVFGVFRLELAFRACKSQVCAKTLCTNKCSC
jgi:hypothetical protein